MAICGLGSILRNPYHVTHLWIKLWSYCLRILHVRMNVVCGYVWTIWTCGQSERTSVTEAPPPHHPCPLDETGSTRRYRLFNSLTLINMLAEGGEGGEGDTLTPEPYLYPHHHTTMHACIHTSGHNLTGIASQFAMHLGFPCDVISVTHRSD